MNMNTKTTNDQVKPRPNHLLGIYILGISFFMIGYSVITALQHL